MNRQELGEKIDELVRESYENQDPEIPEQIVGQYRILVYETCREISPKAVGSTEKKTRMKLHLPKGQAEA